MRGLGGKLLLAVGALAVVFGGLELSFRALGIRGAHAPRTRDWDHALLPEAERLPGIPLQLRPGASFRLEYDSNPRGYFDERNGLTYRINRHGFRGPDFATAKAPGRYRVAVLGDSFTFGEGVRFEDTFPARLERALGVEVLNLGVPGWATKHEMRFLEQAGLDLGPDLVLVAYVLNDAQYRSGLNLWEDFRAAYEPGGLLRHSRLASWLLARVGRHVLGQRYVEEVVQGALRERPQTRRVAALLGRGLRASEAAGARFAVVIFPFLYRLDASYPFAPIHEQVAGDCARLGIPVLDLFPAFAGREYTDLWAHPSDQHPNEVAHAIAAEAIAAFLRRERLVPEGGV